MSQSFSQLNSGCLDQMQAWVISLMHGIVPNWLVGTIYEKRQIGLLFKKASKILPN